MKNGLALAAKTLLKELGCLVFLICVLKNKVSLFFLRLMIKIKLSQCFKIQAAHSPRKSLKNNLDYFWNIT